MTTLSGEERGGYLAFLVKCAGRLEEDNQYHSRMKEALLSQKKHLEENNMELSVGVHGLPSAPSLAADLECLCEVEIPGGYNKISEKQYEKDTGVSETRDKAQIAVYEEGDWLVLEEVVEQYSRALDQKSQEGPVFIKRTKGLYQTAPPGIMKGRVETSYLVRDECADLVPVGVEADTGIVLKAAYRTALKPVVGLASPVIKTGAVYGAWMSTVLTLPSKDDNALTKGCMKLFSKLNGYDEDTSLDDLRDGETKALYDLSGLVAFLSCMGILGCAAAEIVNGELPLDVAPWIAGTGVGTNVFSALSRVYQDEKNALLKQKAQGK